jgi:PadR family transcriptional regulator, regulatory protein PadR
MSALHSSCLFSIFEDTLCGMESPITAKAALLQALVSAPGYGLDLIERVKERTNGAVVLGQGSIYPALRALESEGLIESYESEEAISERGGRPRRYYRLTAEGLRAAREQGRVLVGLIAEVVHG